MPYTDEERERVLASARATLARPMPDVGPTRVESRADRWRREADEAEAERKRERDAKLTDTEAARLEMRMDAKCAELVAAEIEFLKAVIVELVAELRRDITAEITEAVGALRADVNVHRAIDKSDNVSELPSFLREPV